MLTNDNIIDMIKSNSSKVDLSENHSVIKIYSKNLVTKLRPNIDIDGTAYVGYEVRKEDLLIANGVIYNVLWRNLLDVAQEKNKEDVKNLIFSEYGIE